MDNEFWRLWPLAEVLEENREGCRDRCTLFGLPDRLLVLSAKAGQRDAERGLRGLLQWRGRFWQHMAWKNFSTHTPGTHGSFSMGPGFHEVVQSGIDRLNQPPIPARREGRGLWLFTEVAAVRHASAYRPIVVAVSRAGSRQACLAHAVQKWGDERRRARIRPDVPDLWACEARDHAHGRLPIFLRMPTLRLAAESERR